MVFIKYLPNAQFAFHAVSKPTGFVQNMAPCAPLRCFSKVLIVFSTAKTCLKRSFELWACSTSDNGHLVVEWMRHTFNVGLEAFWGLGANGWLMEISMKLLCTVSGVGNVSICYLRYGFSVSNGIKNMYCTQKLAYCKCIPSPKACSMEQLVCLKLDFSSLPTTFFWVWRKCKLHHWK